MSTATRIAGARPAADGVAAAMTAAEFQRITALVNQLTGIVIKEHKREMVHSRISRRLRALGLPNFAAYLDLVESPRGADEIGELINVITTNLTAFFRENHHFEHLQQEILDPMAAQRAGRIRIWSSACSSGEEPYSIAMTVLGSAAAASADLKILATDLDTNMLQRASNGVYPEDRVKPIPAHLAKRALTRCASGDYAFSDAAKRMITFRQINLLHDWPMSGPFDAIFCRNVLIYFDADTKAQIVNRMAQLLRPDGALYLGHSESLLGEHPLVVSEGRTIYRRRA